MKLTLNPTLYLPKGMSRQEYIAYAQSFAKPSGESFYTLIVRDIYLPTDEKYPFDVRDIERRFFKTFDEAVEAMKAVVASQDYMPIYNFKIERTLFDSPEILSAVEFLYDSKGNLLDSHISHYQYSEWNSQPFFGIPDEQVRFHRGDIVEVCYAGEVRLGIVEYESRSYASKYEDYKWLCQKDRWYGADDGNDTFCVAFSSDEDDWDTFFGVDLMSPRYEIPEEKRRELESLLKSE